MNHHHHNKHDESLTVSDCCNIECFSRFFPFYQTIRLVNDNPKKLSVLNVIIEELIKWVHKKDYVIIKIG